MSPGMMAAHRSGTLATAGMILMVSAAMAVAAGGPDEASASSPSRSAGESDMVLFDFSLESDVSRFVGIHDVVMGGASRGALEHDPGGYGVFRGVVSLENNGGFASVRSLPRRLDLSGKSGIRIRVRGDGHGYKLNLKMDGYLDGVQYRVEFRPPAGEWTEVDFPFEEFVPTFRGRILRDVEPLDPSRVATVGFLISDKQEGPFRLDVAWIHAAD